MADRSKQEAAVRAAVRTHLARFPLAGDTAEGIVKNWMPAGACGDAACVIDEVLVSMVADGELERVELPGGGSLYVRGPRLDDT